MGDNVTEIKIQFNCFSSNCQKVTKQVCLELEIPCEYIIEGETKVVNWL